MQAAVLQRQAPIEENPLGMMEIGEPHPAPSEIRLRVHCCAVCRTDLHVIEGDLPVKRLPLIPGHQVVGIVDEVGAGARRLPGQRVGVAWLGKTCGHCTFCNGGRENLCLSSQYTGYDVDGGYAQYVVVPDDFAYEIPQSLCDTKAAPLLCAGIIGYRALKRAHVPEGGHLLLVGFGSSAHIVMSLAVHRGYQISVLTRTHGHRKLAEQMGAKWVGDDPVRLPTKPQSAILFAPAGKLVPAVLEVLDRGGTLALAGIHMSSIPSLQYDKHIYYERDIHTVTSNTRQDGRDLLAEAAKIGVDPQVTKYPLSEANRALQDMKQSRVDGSGVLVME